MPLALPLLVGRVVDNCWSPWAYAVHLFSLASASTGASMVVGTDPTYSSFNHYHYCSSTASNIIGPASF